MSKRITAGVLWTLAVWTGWSMFATFAGAPLAIAPVLGLAAGFLFAVDPFGRIWSTPDVAAAPASDAPVLAELA